MHKLGNEGLGPKVPRANANRKCSTFAQQIVQEVFFFLFFIFFTIILPTTTFCSVIFHTIMHHGKMGIVILPYFSSAMTSWLLASIRLSQR